MGQIEQTTYLATQVMTKKTNSTGRNDMNWDTTKEETHVIHAIAKRAVTFYPDVPLLDIEMDVTAVHLNDCELKLEELLAADNFNFTHDIAGILNNLNRRTVELENCFLPRFAKGES